MPQTWFGRVLHARNSMDRSCGGLGLVVRAGRLTAPHPLPAASASDMPGGDLCSLCRQPGLATCREPAQGNFPMPSRVEPLHDARSADDPRARKRINAAAAGSSKLPLLGDRQIVLTGSSLCAQAIPALVSAPSKKIVAPASAPRSGHAATSHRSGGGKAVRP